MWMACHQSHCQAYEALPSNSSFSSLATSLAPSPHVVAWVWILALEPFSAFLLSFP
jgi:hypothetical protein